MTSANGNGVASSSASAATATAKDEVEARLLASIEVITKGLQSSAANTSEMVGALSDFEERVNKLESAVQPIHALTAKLTAAQRNINATLTNFEKVHLHFRANDEVRGILQRSALIKSDEKSEREQYYRALQRLCEARTFIERHPEFMSSASHFNQLDTMRQFATDSMCIEFEVSLERYAASSDDYVGPHIDEDYQGEDALVMHEALPTSVGKRLREIVQCLVDCGLESIFTDAYARSRGRTVSDALDQLAASVWGNDEGALGGSSQKLRDSSRLHLTVRTTPSVHTSAFASPNPSAQTLPAQVHASTPAPVSVPSQTQQQRQAQQQQQQQIKSPATDRSGSVAQPSISGASISAQSAQQALSPASLAPSTFEDDSASDAGHPSTKSVKVSKSKRWKDKILGRSRRASKKTEGPSPQVPPLSVKPPAPMPRTDRATTPGAVGSEPSPAASSSDRGLPEPPLLTSQSSAAGLRAILQHQQQQPSTPHSASFRSEHQGASGDMHSSSMTSHKSAAHLKKYMRGEHGMIELLDLASYALEAELAIAIRALPRGRTGRRLFLDGMVGPCERLARIGMKDALEYTHKTYAASEAIFAAVDVLEKIEDLRPRFYDILAPGAISYLAEDAREPGSPRKRSESADRSPTNRDAATSRRSENALPQEAWSQFNLLGKSWRSDAVQSLPRAYNALLQPIDKIPDSASVHPASTRVLSFARRLCEYRRVVQSLLTPDGDETNQEIQEREFCVNIEQLFDNFAKVLFKASSGRSEAGSASVSALFLVNNMHFVVSGASREKGYLGDLMESSEVLQAQRQDLEKSKDIYLAAVTAPLKGVLSSPDPLAEITPDATNPPSEQKKLIVDFCSAWQLWLDTIQQSQCALEVPNFELRTELRFRVRSALLETYKKGYQRLESSAYVQRKGLSNFLAYSPDIFSTMLSQFFEVSEAASDPRAMGSFALRSGKSLV